MCNSDNTLALFLRTAPVADQGTRVTALELVTSAAAMSTIRLSMAPPRVLEKPVGKCENFTAKSIVNC